MKWTPLQVNKPNRETGSTNVEQGIPVQDKTISIGPHWQYGWLRRPELDEPIGYAYEEPDGDIVYIQRKSAMKWVRLRCMQDSKTGEKYLCLYRK